LKRDFGCKLWSFANLEKRMLFAQDTILGQITASLTHDPDRHALDWLGAAGAEK
jgi:hypothetical protein